MRIVGSAFFVIGGHNILGRLATAKSEAAAENEGNAAQRIDILPSLTRGDSYGCRVLHQTGLPLCSFGGFLLSTKLKLYQTSP